MNKEPKSQEASTRSERSAALTYFTTHLWGAVQIALGFGAAIGAAVYFFVEKRPVEAIVTVATIGSLANALYGLGTERVKIAKEQKDGEILRLKGKIQELRARLPPPMSHGEHIRKSRLKEVLGDLKGCAAKLHSQVAHGLAENDVKYTGHMRPIQYNLVPPGSATPSNVARLWSLIDDASWWHEDLMNRSRKARLPHSYDPDHPLIDEPRDIAAAGKHRDLIIEEIERIEDREGLRTLAEVLPPHPPPED